MHLQMNPTILLHPSHLIVNHHCCAHKNHHISYHVSISGDSKVSYSHKSLLISTCVMGDGQTFDKWWPDAHQVMHWHWYSLSIETCIDKQDKLYSRLSRLNVPFSLHTAQVII